jgi:uncharacterized membrane protein YeaQ/YmgE (transglycosylase-associated protein family)
MGILGWIVFGLIVGAIAKLLMPGRDPGGIIVTMLLGIAGAVLGGFVGRALGLYGEGEAAGRAVSDDGGPPAHGGKAVTTSHISTSRLPDLAGLWELGVGGSDGAD